MELAAKLQMRPEQSVALVNAPADFEPGDLGDHPRTSEAGADLVLVFARDGDEIRARAETLGSSAARGALTWIAHDVWSALRLKPA